MFRVILSGLALVATLSLASAPREARGQCYAFYSSHSYSPYCGFSIFADYPAWANNCFSYYEFYDDDIPSTCRFEAKAWCDRNNVCSGTPDAYDTDTASDPGFLVIALLCSCGPYQGKESEVRVWHFNKPYQSCTCASSCSNFEYREIVTCD